MALVLRRVHLQDGPAHHLPHGRRVPGGGEPHVVGEHLQRELVAGDGEQGRHPQSLLVRPGPAARPRSKVDLQDRGVRPDPSGVVLTVSHSIGKCAVGARAGQVDPGGKH